ncbi:MAG: Methylmuconolactone methyl-isomerase, partial [Acidimicrobiales bacterium]|nr:Methylmuconolactone methyl-isomerase [Acidimicrobiales bacterium]
MQLFAFVRRKDGLTREQFLHHWHEVHGPLIR